MTQGELRRLVSARVMVMSAEQPNNQLHGITLKAIVEDLVMSL